MADLTLFQWVILQQDVPQSLIKVGDRGVIVDFLPASARSPAGCTLEIFRHGETLDVVAVPVAWITPVDQVWGQPAASVPAS